MFVLFIISDTCGEPMRGPNKPDQKKYQYGLEHNYIKTPGNTPGVEDSYGVARDLVVCKNQPNRFATFRE